MNYQQFLFLFHNLQIFFYQNWIFRQADIERWGRKVYYAVSWNVKFVWAAVNTRIELAKLTSFSTYPRLWYVTSEVGQWSTSTYFAGRLNRPWNPCTKVHFCLYLYMPSYWLGECLITLYRNPTMQIAFVKYGVLFLFDTFLVAW